MYTKRMQTYVEYVILDNLIIDYMLLKCTYFVLHKKNVFWWLFFFSIIGSVFATIFPLLKINGIFNVLVKITFMFLYVFLFSRCKSLKEYIKYLMTFITLTFVCGGAVFGLNSIFNTKNSYTIYNIPVGITILIVYLILKIALLLFDYFYRKKDIIPYIRKCIAQNGKVSIELDGFIDTGNNTYDNFGTPLVFCGKNTAKKLINLKTKIENISIQTVTGKSFVKSFFIDNLQIIDKPIINITNVKVAVIENGRIADNECDLILHSSFMGGCSERVFKKV